MRFNILIASLLLFCMALCTYGALVVPLEEEEVEYFVKKRNYVMLKIYSPNCGHCKKLAPEYYKAAKIAQRDKKPYHFIKVDATKNPGVSKTYNANGFPTLKLFVNGSVLTYEGNRTAEDIIKYIDKKVGATTTELKTEEEIRKVMNEKGVRCILSSADKEIIKKYGDLAREEDYIEFYHASDELVRKVFPEVTAETSVVLLKDFDEGKAILAKYGLPRTDFRNFLRYHEFPIVSECTNRAFETSMPGKGERTLVMLLHPIGASNLKELEAEFRELAIAKRSKQFMFIMSDIKGEACKRFAENSVIEEKHLPTMQILHYKNNEPNRYAYNGPFTGKEMSKFFQDWQSNKVEKAVKSEEIPTPAENPGPVYKVVGKSFSQEVMMNDQDVLVKFYAPWCGHCQQMAPIYKSVAEKLKNNKKIKFVEIDSTKNEISGHPVQSYPTLKFFPAKDKQTAIPYEGERTEEGFIKFLKEKTSYPDTKFDL